MYILYCHVHIHVIRCIFLVLVSPRLIHQICICGTATSMYETEECVLQNILQVFSCHVRSPQLLSQDIESDVADRHLPHHIWHCSSFSCAHMCAGKGVTGQADHNIFNLMGKKNFWVCNLILLRYYKYRDYNALLWLICRAILMIFISGITGYFLSNFF